MDAFGISAQSAIVSQRQILNFGGIKLRPVKRIEESPRNLERRLVSLPYMGMPSEEVTKSLARIQKPLTKTKSK